MARQIVPRRPDPAGGLALHVDPTEAAALTPPPVLSRLSRLSRLTRWATMHLTQEHHCAVPVDGRNWDARPEQGSIRPQDRYHCPECGQRWFVTPAS